MISKVEQEILNILRDLKPYERIEIIKDQHGRPDHYLITRTQKVILDPKVVLTKETVL